MTDAEAEMIAGYIDGRDPDSPKPGPNRSDAYRHGWLNGRDDRLGCPRQSAEASREQAAEILAADDREMQA